jgi:hypothetical protein
MPDLREHARVMRVVADDCEVDATKLDSTPFTPRGMGETFGSTLAMIAACAKSVAAVADALADHQDAHP